MFEDDLQGVIIELFIPADRYLAYYAGDATNVSAKSIDGRRVQFPAHVLKPFVTHGGIEGRFILFYDKNNKFVSIKRVENES